MKNGPDIVSAPAESESSRRFNSALRFWACFFFCLLVLGIFSGLMLAGLFLFMGYHVF
jgi:hypothetical protein